jgi:hypothetical protein
MSYFAQISDLQNRYGVLNMSIYADLNNDGNSTTINNRLNLALSNADSWVYGFLRKSKYDRALPTIVDSNGNIPLELTNAAVMYAGWWLVTARGTRDYDKDGKPLNHLYCDYMESEKMMKLIAEGTHFLMDVQT